jgi:AcrR family transcriptional regulator
MEDPMPRPAPDRTALLEGLAAHVLRHGLAAASLRPLAASVGTSDRMLIYHFGSKEALLAEVLTHLAGQLAAGLEAALPAQRMAREADLVAAVIALMRAPEVQPYVGLWFDILSAGAHRSGPPSGTRTGGPGAAILRIYLDWIAARHPEGAAGAERCLALIEGLLVIETAGSPDMVDRVIAGLQG